MDIKKNQFGVWLDGHHATVVSKKNEDSAVEILQHIKGEKEVGNSNENAAHNHAITAQHKFFKEIAHEMQNAHYIHLTGPGVAQEQFKHYLADTPQFKNVKVDVCVSNKMSDEALTHFFSEKLK